MNTNETSTIAADTKHVLCLLQCQANSIIQTKKPSSQFSH